MDSKKTKSFETEKDFITAIEGGTLCDVHTLMETKARAQAWWREGMAVQFALNATYPNMPGRTGCLYFVEDPATEKARIIGFVPMD